MTEIKTIKCGDVNCFLVTQNGKSILIDTGRNMFRKRVFEKCKDADVKLIVLTHGHSDHIQNAKYLSEKLGAPIAIHEKDVDIIGNNTIQPLRMKGLNDKIGLAIMKVSCGLQKCETFVPDVYIKEGDRFDDYGINAEIVELPGHTNGSIAVDLNQKYLFVGDALMNMPKPSVSNIYHKYDELIESAKKISNIKNRVILFGHGKPVSNREWVK